MASSKYPLKPLLEHRERAVDDRTAELGGVVRAREAAAEVRERAEVSQRAAESAASAVRTREQELLADGSLTVADLARGQAWEIGAQTRIGQLQRATETASLAEDEAREAEAAKRTELARAMADRDVVAKDEARFDERVAKKRAAAEEEQAEEAYRGDKQ